MGRLRAFSLVELIVTVGVLVLMLALSGQIFSLTSRSTGQATALTSTHQLFRSFERTLREDLRYVRPGDSVMVIYARPVNAYWTAAGKAADDNGDPIDGYPHLADPERESDAGDGVMVAPRADLLMFFTARKAYSRVFPGVTSQAQQVVYGHVTTGEYVPLSDGEFEFMPDPGAFPEYPAEVSPVPAEEWHLGRRSVLLLPTVAPPPDGTGQRWAVSLTEDGESDENVSILKGTTDVVGNFVYADEVLTPQTLLNPACPGWPHFLPGVFYTGSCNLNDPQIFARSQLDLTPPAPMAQTLGHYFLPGCASFKVEWALDANSEFVGGRLAYEREVHWLDQGDLSDPPNPLASLEVAIADAIENGDSTREGALEDLVYGDLGHGGTYSLAERFREHPEWYLSPADGPQLVVFNAARGVIGSDDAIPEDVFPAALRITIDMLDKGHRFDRPMRHVMVIPVGQ